MNKLLVSISVYVMLTGVAHALEITHVSHEPKMFKPGENKLLSINFTLSETSDVSVNIFDDRSLLIRKIVSEDLSKGRHQMKWDGKDQNGKAVPAEAYSYAISATDGNATVEHDFSDYTGTQQFRMENIKWNKKNKQFEYMLKKPSRVFIRIGLANNGPLLATVLNWVPRASGKHTEQWDGLDASGVLDLASHPKMIIDMQAYELSKNTFLVGPKIKKSNYLTTLPMGEQKRQIKYQHKKKMVAANQQAPQTRGDYLVQLKLPGNLKKNKQGVPVVSGIVPVVLDVNNDKYRQIAIDRRSEPVFFVDGQFAMENEVGFLPMTWRLDTTAMNEGEHFLTVNLRGYEGNFGIASRKIYVKHQ